MTGGHGMNGPQVVGLVGNPRPQSRTHSLARTLTREIARVLGAARVTEVDLAPAGSRAATPSLART